MIKSLDERIAEKEIERTNVYWGAWISSIVAALLILSYFISMAQFYGGGEADYFAGIGVFQVFLYGLSPIFVVSVICAIVFSVKTSRRTKELRELRQRLKNFHMHGA